MLQSDSYVQKSYINNHMPIRVVINADISQYIHHDGAAVHRTVDYLIISYCTGSGVPGLSSCFLRRPVDRLHVTFQTKQSSPVQRSMTDPHMFCCYRSGQSRSPDSMSAFICLSYLYWCLLYIILVTTSSHGHGISVASHAT